jgi:hypothetical protein
VCLPPRGAPEHSPLGYWISGGDAALMPLASFLYTRSISPLMGEFVNFWGVCGGWMLISPSPLSSLLLLNEARGDRQATHLPVFDECSISSGSLIVRPLEPFAKHAYNA